jgi:hypothetical protein
MQPTATPHRSVLTLAALFLATAGAGTFALPDSAVASGATSPIKLIHRRIDVSLQSIMDQIHNDLPTQDYEHYTGSVGPLTAFLEDGGNGGFTTNCYNPNPNHVLYRYQSFEIYPEGVALNTCHNIAFFPSFAAKPPYTEKSKPGAFNRDLDHIGDQVLTAVDLRTTETTTSVHATRARGTVIYELPSGTSSSTGTEVEKIALTTKKSYTEATISVVT